MLKGREGFLSGQVKLFQQGDKIFSEDELSLKNGKGCFLRVTGVQ
jgi:hypothetical protein